MPPPPGFLVSVADKGLSVCCKWFRINSCRWLVSVDSRGVKRSKNAEALPASAGEEAPEWEGRMDLSADRRLAEVLAAGRTVQRRKVARVRVVLLDQAEGQLRVRLAMWLAAPWGALMKERAEQHWWETGVEEVASGE